jgi:hypothetical protein
MQKLTTLLLGLSLVLGSTALFAGNATTKTRKTRTKKTKAKARANRAEKHY